MRFTEAWFSEHSQQAVATLAKSVAHLDGASIEVGCWEGCSTIAIANAIAPEVLHAVDTWEGSPGEVSAELAAERDVFATFRSNVADATEGNICTHRMGWREFFEGWDGPVRFIHIDATHTYEEVRDNIEAVLPHMVRGGVVCGDDAHHEPIREAVRDTLGNAFMTASLWHWEV